MATSPKDQINKYVADFELQHGQRLDTLSSNVESLRDACNVIEQAWSGSYIGWHGKMYFDDFQKPLHHQRFSGEWGAIHGMPDGWEEKDADQVRAKIDELVGAGFSVDQFEHHVKDIRSALVDLRAEVDLMSSALPIPTSGKSRDVLKEIR
jgi:hypothetical protein